MNTPNKITITRIVMTVIIIILLLFPWGSVGVSFPTYSVKGVIISLQFIIAGILFIIGSLTDFLDGYIARKYNMVTDLGKMLDAIADKALVNTSLIILAGLGKVHPIIPVIFVFRDIVVDAIKMQAASKGKVVAAIMSGKIKTASQMIGISLVFFSNLPFEMWGYRVAEVFLYFASVMTIISMIEYYHMNKKLFK